MLNGLDPILIFSFYKDLPVLTTEVSKVPLAESDKPKIPLIPIPLYLSESLTGLYISEEEKNIDLQTTAETVKGGGPAFFSQKGLSSTVSINMLASKNSVGLTLLLSLMDIIFPQVTDRNYGITYLHGAITIFDGLLHSFNVSQNSNNDLYTIKLELSRSDKPKADEVKKESKPTDATLNQGSRSTSVVTPKSASGAGGGSHRVFPPNGIPIRTGL